MEVIASARWHAADEGDRVQSIRSGVNLTRVSVESD